MRESSNVLAKLIESISDLSNKQPLLIMRGVVSEVHQQQPKAKALIKTASGEFETPFLIIAERKQVYIKNGNEVMLITPNGNIKQGILYDLAHDPEQDHQNKRLDDLEKRVTALEKLSHGH